MTAPLPSPDPARRQPARPTPVVALGHVGPPPLPPEGGPLSHEHLQQLAAARAASAKIRRGIAVARFDGWSIALFAALTVAFGLGSPSALVLGVGMGLVAAVELRTIARLRRLDPHAPRTLALNQLALAGLLIGYAVWRLVSSDLKGGGGLEGLSQADLDQWGDIGQSVQSLSRTIALSVDVGLIVIALCAQGGAALFYLSRAKHVRSYVAQTPPWIVQMQQAEGTL